MVQKVSFQIDVTTEADDRTAANPHSGGWSEQIYVNDDVASDGTVINALAAARSPLLPKQCFISGWRIGKFSIVGNRLLPQGSTAIGHRYPGSSTFSVDVPQASLTIVGSLALNPSKGKYILRGLPDEVVLKGEYQPTDAFKSRLTTFMNLLKNGNYLSVVRDRTAELKEVISIAANGLITYSGGTYATGTVIRMVRVKDDEGKPVKGVFRLVANPTVGQPDVLQAWDGRLVSKANGHIREDKIAASVFTSANFTRASVKKIGRPREGYRGRRSKISA